jgi:D-alanyl-D-alanine dipeptidase
MLAEAMIKFGYEGYEFEFWHFSHGGKEGREVDLAMDIPVG